VTRLKSRTARRNSAAAADGRTSSTRSYRSASRPPVEQLGSESKLVRGGPALQSHDAAPVARASRSPSVTTASAGHRGSASSPGAGPKLSALRQSSHVEAINLLTRRRPCHQALVPPGAGWAWWRCSSWSAGSRTADRLDRAPQPGPQTVAQNGLTDVPGLRRHARPAQRRPRPGAGLAHRGHPSSLPSRGAVAPAGLAAPRRHPP